MILYNYLLQWGWHEDLQMYLPEKVIIPWAARPRWVSRRVDTSLRLPKVKSITVLFYDFSTKNKNKSTFTFVVEVMLYLKRKDFLTNFIHCYQTILK